MGDPESQNLFHLIPEVRARLDAETDFNGGEDDDDDDKDEEGGNREGRRSVAFPRMIGEQETTDAPRQETVWLFSSSGSVHVDLLLSSQ